MLTILLYHNCIILVGILSCNKSGSPIKLLLQVVSSWLYKPVLRKLKKKSPGAYPPELRVFAMTNSIQLKRTTMCEIVLIQDSHMSPSFGDGVIRSMLSQVSQRMC